MGKSRDAYRVLVGNLWERDHLEDKRRWKDNIKMDLREVAWDEWTGLIWLRFGTEGGGLVNAVMNVLLP